MSPDPLLLGGHITFALALTVLVGVQCLALSHIRVSALPSADIIGTVRATSWSIPVLCVVVFGSGVALLADHARGGPWVAAGVLSTIVIAAGSAWTRRRTLHSDIPGSGTRAILGSVQWGIPGGLFRDLFEHGSRHGDVNDGFVVVGSSFVVADGAAVLGDPAERTLDHSAAREYDEALGRRRGV
jgi:hypothetical protein